MKPAFRQMGKKRHPRAAMATGRRQGRQPIIVAMTIEAVGEALLFCIEGWRGSGAGAQALMGGFASSRILEVHGERMIKRNFDGASV